MAVGPEEHAHLSVGQEGCHAGRGKQRGGAATSRRCSTAGTRSLISPGFIARTVGVKKQECDCSSCGGHKVGRPRNSIWDRWWIFCKARSVRRLRVHFDIFEKVLCVLDGCVVEFVRVAVLVDEELQRELCGLEFWEFG